jgi:hypothetical protein
MGSVYVEVVIEYVEDDVHRPFLAVRPEGAALFQQLNDSYALKPEQREGLRATIHAWTRAQYAERTDTVATELLCADLQDCARATTAWRGRGKTVPTEFQILMTVLECLGPGARLVYWWENS